MCFCHVIFIFNKGPASSSYVFLPCHFHIYQKGLSVYLLTEALQTQGSQRSKQSKQAIRYPSLTERWWRTCSNSQFHQTQADREVTLCHFIWWRIWSSQLQVPQWTNDKVLWSGSKLLSRWIFRLSFDHRGQCLSHREINFFTQEEPQIAWVEDFSSLVDDGIESEHYIESLNRPLLQHHFLHLLLWL